MRTIVKPINKPTKVLAGQGKKLVKKDTFKKPPIKMQGFDHGRMVLVMDQDHVLHNFIGVIFSEPFIFVQKGKRIIPGNPKLGTADSYELVYQKVPSASPKAYITVYSAEKGDMFDVKLSMCKFV